MEIENQNSEPLSFRRLTHEDLPRIHDWLHRPHVAKWWYDDLGTLEEVSEKYSKYIIGEEPGEPYLILHEERPIGFIQWYRVADDEEYAQVIAIPHSAGIDLFISEEEFLYRGLGAEIIHLFIENVIFADDGIEVCIIDPEPENHAAIRAYEKVGFTHFKSADTPYGPAYFMKLSREDFLG